MRKYKYSQTRYRRRHFLPNYHDFLYHLVSSGTYRELLIPAYSVWWYIECQYGSIFDEELLDVPTALRGKKAWPGPRFRQICSAEDKRRHESK